MTDRTLSVAALAEILRHHGNLTRARRANLARPDVYADLVTAGDLVTGWLIAHQAGRDDSTEIAITDDRNGSSDLTVAEAAAIANVTPASIYRAIAEGRLKATKRRPYLIAPADLAAYHPRAA